MGIAHGDSTEFLLVETFDQLEVVRHAAAAAWNGPRRFEELEKCLAGKALTSYKRLVHDRHPNPADKTDANYEELCMLMPTDLLGDHTYPGNKICQYVDQKGKFMNFCREDGRREKPTGVLRCMRELRLLGSRCQHSFGVAGIFADDEFKQVYWNIFPGTMQDWLTNDQSINPFDPAGTLMWMKLQTTFNATGNCISKT